jgi:hypothetical protein
VGAQGRCEGARGCKGLRAYYADRRMDLRCRRDVYDRSAVRFMYRYEINRRRDFK